jgi:hypothetical protein
MFQKGSRLVILGQIQISLLQDFMDFSLPGMMCESSWLHTLYQTHTSLIQYDNVGTILS